MNETTTTPVQTTTTKKAPKKAKKAAKAKVPSRAMAETPAGERRKALIKLLRKSGADKAGSAIPLSKIADRLGYSKFDAYGLVNGTSGKAGSNPNCLVHTGHVKVVSHEGEGLAAYLTAKGKADDFSGAPFARGSNGKA